MASRNLNKTNSGIMGLKSLSSTDVYSMNDLYQYGNGIFSVYDTTASHRPPTDNPFWVVYQGMWYPTNSWGVQIAHSSDDNGDLYIRRRGQSNWGSWHLIAHSDLESGSIEYNPGYFYNTSIDVKLYKRGKNVTLAGKITPVYNVPKNTYVIKIPSSFAPSYWVPMIFFERTNDSNAKSHLEILFGSGGEIHNQNDDLPAGVDIYFSASWILDN